MHQEPSYWDIKQVQLTVCIPKDGRKKLVSSRESLSCHVSVAGDKFVVTNNGDRITTLRDGQSIVLLHKLYTTFLLIDPLPFICDSQQSCLTRITPAVLNRPALLYHPALTSQTSSLHLLPELMSLQYFLFE